MKGYIYTLRGEIKNDIFYVGATVSIQKRKNVHDATYIPIIGCRPILEIIEEVDFEERKELNRLEAYWIQQFVAWGFKLLNYHLHYGVDIRALKVGIEFEKESLSGYWDFSSGEFKNPEIDFVI